MRIKRILTYFLLFIGIALTIAALLLNTGILEKVMESNGIFGLNKVDISSKNNYSFTVDDVEKLREELRVNNISYYVLNYSDVHTDNRLIKNVRIYGTDFRYCYFNNLNLRKGSYFTENAEIRCDKAAIIDTELAWGLFNSVDVIGYKLNIYNEDFTIIGLMEKGGRLDKSGNLEPDIIEKKIDTGEYGIYIPATVQFLVNGSERIDGMSVYTEESADVERALNSLGEDSSQYILTDYHEQHRILVQKNEILRFVMGAGMIIIIAMYGFFIAKSDIGMLRTSLKTDYLMDIFKKNRGHFLASLSKLIILGVGIILIIKLVSFDLYIPRENIPERLINTEFYNDLSVMKSQELNIRIKTIDLNAGNIILQKSQEITTKLTLFGVIAGYLLSIIMTIIIMNQKDLIYLLAAIPVFILSSFLIMRLFSYYILSLPQAGADLVAILIYWINLSIIGAYNYIKFDSEGRDKNV